MADYDTVGNAQNIILTPASIFGNCCSRTF